MQKLLALPLVLTLAAAAVAQSPWIPTPKSNEHKLNVDSKYVDNTGSTAKVVFSHTVRVPGAVWLRIRFDKTNLPRGTKLQITGLQKNWVQYLDGVSLVDYFHKSCFFDGEAIKVELVAGPNTKGNRVLIVGATAGTGEVAAKPESICGTADNRVLSTDKRQGRLSVGCTGWLCDKDIMLTAGHCVASTRAQILSLNVPLSTSTGGLVASHPNDQYPTVASTFKWLNSGVGADWAIGKVGKNSNTGKFPGDAQGSWYSLGTVPSSPTGNTIRITGYGTVSSPISRTWNQVQKTHVGPMYSVNATTIRYRTDTTGGNSGSPVIHNNTGKVVGIHTHAGCSTSSTSSNPGTRIDRADLVAAIKSIKGGGGGGTSIFIPDNSSTTGTCNVIPFGHNTVGTWSNQKYQALITANDLGGSKSKTICDLAFVSCVAGIRHFDRIEIRMSQTNLTTLGTNFATNLGRSNVVTVLAQRSYDWHQSSNQWERIGLERDYNYVSSRGRAIVVQITVWGAILKTTSTVFPGHRRGTRQRVFAYNWTTSPPVTGSSGLAGTKMEVLFSAADLHKFGLSCKGSNGKEPALNFSGTGKIGSNYSMIVTNALPNANVYYSIGFSLWDPPLDLGIVGAAGCMMYFNNTITLLYTCNSLGSHTLRLPVPTGTQICLRAYFQAFPFDRAANNLGLVSTNYVRLLTGN